MQRNDQMHGLGGGKADTDILRLFMRLMASCRYSFWWPNIGNVCVVFQKEAWEHTSSFHLLLMTQGNCSKVNCWTFLSFMHWFIQSSSDWATLLALCRGEGVQAWLSQTLSLPPEACTQWRKHINYQPKGHLIANMRPQNYDEFYEGN